MTATSIDPLSASSLKLFLLTDTDELLGKATGFVVAGGLDSYLITNWHVLSGRNAQTGQPMSATGAVPAKVAISHHGTVLGNWVARFEALLDGAGQPMWKEHPAGRTVDVVALPLTSLDAVQLYPLDLALAVADVRVEPGMPVFVVGFPFGLSTGGEGVGLPIWKTGHVAIDHAVDYAGQQCFLIDATTRGGMSGSPVMLRMYGGFHNEGGDMVLGAGATTRFLGVYSGRLNAESELGQVWRPSVITEILSAS